MKLLEGKKRDVQTRKKAYFRQCVNLTLTTTTTTTSTIGHDKLGFWDSEALARVGQTSIKHRSY